jgi:hypothetical protein
MVQVNYTYSKALDDVSNGGFFGFGGSSIINPENPYNFKFNYGPANYDARHVVNANYVWQVPVRRALGGRGWAPLVDGWQVSGTVFYRTGFPFTVVDNTVAGNLGGQNYGGPIFAIPENPAALGRSCNSELYAGYGATQPTPCLTVSQQSTDPTAPACTIGVSGDFGISGCQTVFGPRGLRNAFRGPTYFDTDFNVTKKFAIPHWERGSFQLGFQFFNLFNHPNFANPVGDISSPSFGTIQSQVNPPTSILGSFLGGDASPRLIQLKAQLVF